MAVLWDIAKLQVEKTSFEGRLNGFQKAFEMLLGDGDGKRDMPLGCDAFSVCGADVACGEVRIVPSFDFFMAKKGRKSQNSALFLMESLRRRGMIAGG